MRMTGQIKDVEPKLNAKGNKIWLLKASLITDDGSTVWIGGKPDEAAAWIDRVMEERDLLPIESRTHWQLEVENRSETAKNGNVYHNNYVTAARSVEDSASMPMPASNATPPQPSTTPAVQGPNAKDRLIVRQVAAKLAGELVVALISKHKSAVDISAALEMFKEALDPITRMILEEPEPEPEPVPESKSESSASTEEMFEETL